MKVGDRVIVNGEYDGLEFNNSKGVIIDETERISKEEDVVFLVEFDEFIAGHGSSHGGKPGHCWYIPEDMIKKENTMKEKIEELEKELAELKAQFGQKYEPKKGRWRVCGDSSLVQRDLSSDLYVQVGRVFDTKEKAEKARDIMVKHDIILKYVIDHAPDYEPCWNSLDKNYSVTYCTDNSKWYVRDNDYVCDLGTIFMPAWLADKLADDLNNNRIEGM